MLLARRAAAPASALVRRGAPALVLTRREHNAKNVSYQNKEGLTQEVCAWTGTGRAATDGEATPSGSTPCDRRRPAARPTRPTHVQRRI